MAIRDTDSFTYSNGLLGTVSGGKWTKLSGRADMNITSNQVSGDGSGDSMGVITSWGFSTTDHYSKLTIVSATGDGGGPAIRCDAVNNGYVSHTSAGAAVDTSKLVGGVFTALATSGAVVLSAGKVLSYEQQGTTQIVTLDGVTILTNLSESSVASGKPGLYNFTVTDIFDSWVGGDFASAFVFGSPLLLMGVGL